LIHAQLSEIISYFTGGGLGGDSGSCLFSFSSSPDPLLSSAFKLLIKIIVNISSNFFYKTQCNKTWKQFHWHKYHKQEGYDGPEIAHLNIKLSSPWQGTRNIENYKQKQIWNLNLKLISQSSYLCLKLCKCVKTLKVAIAKGNQQFQKMCTCWDVL
jgi:hypothetical protein